jgi:hypothetical protein
MPGRAARSPPPVPARAVASSVPATPANLPASEPPRSIRLPDQPPPQPTAVRRRAAARSRPPNPLTTKPCPGHPIAPKSAPSARADDPPTPAVPPLSGAPAPPHHSSPASCQDKDPPACQKHPAALDCPLRLIPLSILCSFCHFPRLAKGVAASSRSVAQRLIISSAGSFPAGDVPLTVPILLDDTRPLAVHIRLVVGIVAGTGSSVRKIPFYGGRGPPILRSFAIRERRSTPTLTVRRSFPEDAAASKHPAGGIPMHR